LSEQIGSAPMTSESSASSRAAETRIVRNRHGQYQGASARAAHRVRYRRRTGRLWSAHHKSSGCWCEAQDRQRYLFRAPAPHDLDQVASIAEESPEVVGVTKTWKTHARSERSPDRGNVPRGRHRRRRVRVDWQRGDGKIRTHGVSEGGQRVAEGRTGPLAVCGPTPCSARSRAHARGRICR